MKKTFLFSLALGFTVLVQAAPGLPKIGVPAENGRSFKAFSGNPDGYCKAVFIYGKKYLIRLNSGLDAVISIQDWYSGSYCTNITPIITIVADDFFNPQVDVSLIFDDPYFEWTGWQYIPETGIIYSGTETYLVWGSAG